MQSHLCSVPPQAVVVFVKHQNILPTTVCTCCSSSVLSHHGKPRQTGLNSLLRNLVINSVLTALTAGAHALLRHAKTWEVFTCLAATCRMHLVEVNVTLPTMLAMKSQLGSRLSRLHWATSAMMVARLAATIPTLRKWHRGDSQAVFAHRVNNYSWHHLSTKNIDPMQNVWPQSVTN